MPAALTPSQLAAVEHREGPLLVLAGPGSGKTRVITHRVARLIETGVDPHEILGLTFTNKAAGEMSERVAELVPGTRVWISTFHRFCARLLREWPSAVGLRSNFTIFDDGDQQVLLRQVMRSLELDTNTYSPARMLRRIGRLKNEMVTAEVFARRAEERVGDHFQAVLGQIYPAYQAALLNANAVDFDDLLLHVAGMMGENEELRASLDERYRFVLVDEYQDTNLAQYSIVRALSMDYPNLCATGDPDQSIYGWRGARLRNILDFERDYAGVRTVRLEENFRSAASILRVADELISQNVQRKAKHLIAVRGEGAALRRMLFNDARRESEAIAVEIAAEVEAGRRTASDFAVVYRVNSLSRELEGAFRRQGVAYQIAAGVSFYDRMEIKDLVGYLRLIYNPADVVAFRRIVNKPKRSIGETTQRRVLAFAEAEGITPIEAVGRAGEISTLSAGARRAVGKFHALYQALIDEQSLTMAGLITEIVNKSQYTAGWEAGSNEEDAQRLANVEELITAAAQYDRETKKEGSLEDFLEQISLSNEVDNVDEEAGRVTFMTLHAAKGLEFPCVYIVALEHGILPHARAIENHDREQIEEERRLLFVGVTRAMDQLTLTHARRRDKQGRPLPAIPSEFLREMTLEAVEEAGWSRKPGRGFSRESFDEEDFSQEAAEAEIFQSVESESFEGEEPSSQRPTSAPIKKKAALTLTTAAKLLDGKGGTVELPRGFAQGEKVRHPKYGVGLVVGTDGLARNRRVTVVFDDDQRQRTFLAAKSPLQPVGGG